jgi:hypothetical protein
MPITVIRRTQHQWSPPAAEQRTAVSFPVIQQYYPTMFVIPSEWMLPRRQNDWGHPGIMVG